MKYSTAAALLTTLTTIHALPAKNSAAEMARDIMEDAIRFAMAHQHDSVFQPVWEGRKWAQPAECQATWFTPSLGEGYVCGGYERALGNYFCLNGFLQFCNTPDPVVNCNPVAPRPDRWTDPAFYHAVRDCQKHPLKCMQMMNQNQPVPVDPFACIRDPGDVACRLSPNGVDVICVG